jgi:hypothetical protein
LPEDPATAHVGETDEGFFWRTAPAQLRSAWRLEAQRLGDADMSLLDSRMLRNRILHGIAVGWGLAFAAWAAFGFAAFVAFLLQAFMAVRLLEAVNYFEHWGLQRRQARVRPVDSWDTHAWFTYYGLTGLSRHADHHAWPSRPFQQLRVWDEAPILPAGYVGTVDMVMGRNAEFRHRATLELARCGLGPFDEETDIDPARGAQAAAALTKARVFEAAVEAGADPAQAALEAEKAEAAGGAGRRGWASLPVPVRAGLFVLGFAAAVSLGGWLEAGAGAGLAGLFGLNLWILSVVTTLIVVRRRIEVRGQVALSWAFFFGLLVAVGRLTDAALA